MKTFPRIIIIIINLTIRTNQESVPENEMHKILWNFAIQMDYLILDGQPDLVIINQKKRTCWIVDFAILVNHRVKLKESEKKDMYLGLARELKKSMEHESDSDSDTNCSWHLVQSPKDWYRCCIAVIHIQLYTYTCRNKINNNDKRIHFRKIYLSHFIRNGYERVMCERWVRDWTDCNILTPNSSVFSSTSFSFCWAAQSGVLRAQPSLGAGAHYSILSLTISTCLWHQVIKLFDTHLLLVGVTSAPNSSCPQSRLYPDIFDRMHLLFTQVHLLFDSSAEGQYATQGLEDLEIRCLE